MNFDLWETLKVQIIGSKFFVEFFVNLKDQIAILNSKYCSVCFKFYTTNHKIKQGELINVNCNKQSNSNKFQEILKEHPIKKKQMRYLNPQGSPNVNSLISG